MPLTRRPRLVALDLDGTVVDGNNEIPERNLAAIRALREAGVQLAILTGRRMHTARPQLERLGHQGYAATNSGCIIWDYPREERVAVTTFPAELLMPLAELLAPHSVSFFIADSTDGAEFLYLQREPSPYYDRFRERFVSRIRVIEDASQLAGQQITQLALPQEETLVRELHSRVSQRFGERVLSLAVHWPLVPTMALEVFGPDGHKGHALQQIAGRLGIAREEVLAAGDDVNDIHMLRWAGHGLAMPQAVPAAAEAADEQLCGQGVSALGEYLEGLLELPG